MMEQSKKQQPRVCIYCDCNSRGGVFSYTRRMFDMFASWGWRTSLISHHPDSRPEREISELLLEKADRSVLINRNLSPGQQIRLMMRFLRDERPDTFIPNYRKLSWAAAARASRRQTIQIVGVCHSDHESYYNGALKRYSGIISFYVCPSTKTYNELKTRLPATHHFKLKHIPHYVRREIDRFSQYNKSPFTVIYHGRLREEQKNVSQIIKVAEKVCAANADLQFRLIGDNQEAGFYEKLIKDKQLEERCAILAPQSWSEIQEELANAQVSILTSSYEGFCYTAAEAVAFGLPVLAYNCGDVITDFIQSGVNGYLVPWGDSDAIAEHIISLYNSSELWNELSRNAMHTALTSLEFQTVSRKYRNAVVTCDANQEKWPALRPTYIPDAGKSLRSFIDRMGQKLAVW